MMGFLSTIWRWVDVTGVLRAVHRQYIWTTAIKVSAKRKNTRRLMYIYDQGKLLSGRLHAMLMKMEDEAR